MQTGGRRPQSAALLLLIVVVYAVRPREFWAGGFRRWGL
jgi:hypothetical protein